MALMEAFVVIKASLEPLKRGLALAKSAVSKAVAGMQAVVSKMVTYTKRGMIGIAAVMGVASYAAIKQERAEMMLANALKVSGEESVKAMEKFKAFARSIQQTTIYGDEEVLMLMQLMKSLGVATPNLEEATKQAIGLAAATGRDVQSMAMYIALAQQGEFTMLRRYIPALRSTTDATEQLRIIQEFSAKGFKLAQSEALTTSGALKQMKNAVGDLLEKIGQPFLDNITKAAKAIKDWSEKHQDAINNVISIFDRLIEATNHVINIFVDRLLNKLTELTSGFKNFEAEAKLTDIIWAIGEWADKIWLRIKTVWQSIKDLWNSDSLGESIGYGLNVALSYIERWGKQVWELIKVIADKIGDEFSTRFANKIGIGFIELGNKIGKIPTPAAALVGMGFMKAGAGLVGKGLKPGGTEDIDSAMERISKIPLRDIEVPEALKNAYDSMKDAIEAGDKQIEREWDLIRAKYELEKNKADNLETEAGLVHEQTKKAAAGQVGFVGLKEAWKSMAVGLSKSTETIAIEQGNKTAQQIWKEITRNTNEQVKTTKAIKEANFGTVTY